MVVQGEEKRQEGESYEKPRCSPIGLLPAAWQLKKLGGLCKKVGSGATPRGGQAVYLDRRDSHALIRSQQVFDRRFDGSDLVYISDKHAKELRNVEVHSGDILLNITGDGVTFGRTCIVPDKVLPACVNQHVAIIRLDQSICIPGYLLSFLTHSATKPYIESFNSGGSRRAITKGNIESFEIPLPPLPEQEAIANIFGTLDDKIELNRQMNQTLEAMAQAIFKSWFVDFDPVKAKQAAKALGRDPERAAMAALSGKLCVPKSSADLSVEDFVKAEAELDQLEEGERQELARTAALFPDGFVESEFGLIPEGWKVSNLENLLELVYGKALKKSDRSPGPFPVYGSGGITGQHENFLVEGPGIIIGRKGTVGRIYWEERSFFPIDTVFYVKAKEEVSLEYLFYALQILGLEAMNTDAAVPGLNRNNVYRLKVPQIPTQLIVAFTNLARSLRLSIRGLSQHSETLVELRDSLLPKLLSGELPVSESG